MTKNANAVLYLRSSKDRHDVSIEAQRHELGKFAADQGLAIVAEFRDVVESGKDEDRAGLQELIEAVRRRDRGWSTILVLDTSRLSRRAAAAYIFEERECKPRGVQVVYKNVPQADDAERALIKAVFHGVDEWHSLVSKRKGIAGLRQNVRAGFRAGGRAPYGYRLQHQDVGVMREGRPVLKSRLVAGDEAPRIAAYLKGRAAGDARVPLAARLGLQLSDSTLVGIEWNALTYAGHTVWNVHNERAGGRYVIGEKRRPRDQWEVKRDTHAALITEAEADAILARLEAANLKASRRTPADYLFTGLLKTSAGEPWYGDRHRYYRAGNAHVPIADVDQALLGKVAGDLRSGAFSAELVTRARKSYGREFDAEIANLRGAEASIDARISRFMDMAAGNDGVHEPVLRKVAELERDRKRIVRQIDDARRDAELASRARAVTGEQVHRMLDALATDMERLDRQRLKDFLFSICERVTLNPSTLTARIHYKIPLSRRDRLASPRETEPVPHARTSTCVKVRRAA